MIETGLARGHHFDQGRAPFGLKLWSGFQSRGQPPFKARSNGIQCSRLQKELLKRRGPLMEAGSFDGARRARPVRQRVRAGHGATGRALHRHTYTYMYIYTRRERRPERRTEREKCFAETENPNPKSARESRRSDSPTGAGSTPDFLRGWETTTRPPLLLPWGILACHRPPWEFDNLIL